MRDPTPCMSCHRPLRCGPKGYSRQRGRCTRCCRNHGFTVIPNGWIVKVVDVTKKIGLYK